MQRPLCPLFLFALTLVFSMTAAVGLAQEQSDRELPQMQLTLGAKKVLVEIAATESDRARGLMHRDVLSRDRGMLFVFDQTQIASFWMKNTKMPLDIAFIDESGRIAQIETMAVPGTGKPLRRYTSSRQVRYALEVNAGWFKANKIKPGLVVPELQSDPDKR